MFTVKLTRGNHTKIVEGETVNIYPAGKPEPVETGETKESSGPRPCTNKVRQILIERNGKSSVFYVGHESHSSDLTADLGQGFDLYEYAYIENAHGATTERVYGG